jgi:hypothetical protein
MLMNVSKVLVALTHHVRTRLALSYVIVAQDSLVMDFFVQVYYYIDGRPKPENVQQYLFDGIFCYKLPTDIFIEYNSICINEEDC